MSKTVLTIIALAALVEATAAQPVELYDREAPIASSLYDRNSGEFSGPPGDWDGYFSELENGWSPEDGRSIAIIDSGVVVDHPVIAPVLVAAIDLTGEGPQDQIGHGTFVALQVLAVAGPTPLISIKVFGGDKNGNIDGANRLAEALRIAANRGASVANVSAGVDLVCANQRDPEPPTWLTSCESTDLCQAVDELKERMIVIAAVGNDPEKTGCPACCANAMAIGAMGPDGKVAHYSGRFPDVVAPSSFPHVPIGRAHP